MGVSRAIFMCQNAEYQLRARALGYPNSLHDGEVKLAGTLSLMPNVVTRTWEYWTTRLAMSGRMLHAGKATKASAAGRRASRQSRTKRRISRR